MNVSNKATKKLHKNLNIGWDIAISEAERKITDYRLKIAKLKAAIQTFREQMEKGEPFPCEKK